jgi:ribosome maturation factor RimP
VRPRAAGGSARTPQPQHPVRPGADPRVPIEATVSGLGYELVDVEREGRGLLRVTIDRLPGRVYAQPGDAVTVDDCEQVTRQLQYALEVDGVDYARLEVSSPGLDRPLRRESDYERFEGSEVALALKSPFEGRKSWKGVLARREGGGWELHFDEGKGPQVLGFEVGEVREARLVPVVDFKRRRGEPPAGDAPNEKMEQR